jgi:hypothetical protein
MQALERIALGQTDNTLPSVKQRAAQARLESAQDTAAARTLLDSDDTVVQTLALDALRGKPVDGALLDRLSNMLSSPEPNVRFASAHVLAASAGDGLADRRVNLLISALDGVRRSPNLPPPGRVLPAGLSFHETSYYQYIRALEKLQDGADLLPGAYARTDGPTRTAMAIALAGRGEASVADELRAAVRDGNGAFRTWSIHALGLVGSRDDLPLLQNITREYQPPSTVHSPLTAAQAARAAIQRIERRAAP